MYDEQSFDVYFEGHAIWSSSKNNPLYTTPYEKN